MVLFQPSRFKRYSDNEYPSFNSHVGVQRSSGEWKVGRVIKSINALKQRKQHPDSPKDYVVLVEEPDLIKPGIPPQDLLKIPNELSRS